MEQVIESLAESISQLTGYVIQLQEANAEPPPKLPANGGIVTNVANVLVKVAHQTAGAFVEFPELKKEIDDEADKVGHFTNDLSQSLNQIVTASDRGKGYADLLAACKAIAQSTCYLLILVYGARVKAIQIKAKEAKAKIQRMRESAGKDKVSQELVTDVQGVTQDMGLLGALVNARVKEVPDPEEQQKLMSHSKNITDSRQASVNKVNDWIKNPASEDAHNGVKQQCDDLDRIVDALTNDLKTPEDMDAFKALEQSFNQKGAAAEEAVRANNANRASQAALDNAAKKQAAAKPNVSEAEKPVLQAAQEVAEAASELVGDIKPNPGKAVPADSAALNRAVDRLNQAGERAKTQLSDPKDQAALMNDIGDVDRAAHRLDDAAKASVAAPADASKNQEVEKASAQLQDALDKLAKNAQRRKDNADKAKRDEAQNALRAAEDAARAAVGDRSKLEPGSAAAANADLLEACQKLLRDDGKMVDDVSNDKPAVPNDARTVEGDGQDVHNKGADAARKGNPKHAQATSDLSDKVTQSAHRAQEAAQRAAANPSDGAAQGAVTDTTKDLARDVEALTRELARQRNEAARENLDNLAKAVESEAAVEKSKPHKGLLDQTAALSRDAAKAVASPLANPGQAAADAAKVAEDVSKVVEAGRQAADAEPNSDQKKRILANTAELSNAGAQLAEAAREAAAKPNDIAALSKLNAAGEAVAKAVQQTADQAADRHYEQARAELQRAADRADAASKEATHHERALLEDSKDIAQGSVALLENTHGKKGPEAQAALAENSNNLQKQVMKFVGDGKAASKEIDDPEDHAEKQKVIDSTKEIAKDVAQVIDSAGKASTAQGQDDPAKSLQAKAAVNDDLKKLASAIHDLVNASDAKRQAEAIRRATQVRDKPYGQELLEENANVHDANGRLDRDIADPNKAAGDAAAATNGAGKMANVVKSLAANTPDPGRRKELRAAQGEAKNAQDAAQAAADAYKAAPDDGKKAALQAAKANLDQAADKALAAAATDAAVADLHDAAYRAGKTGTGGNAESAGLLDAAKQVGDSAAALVSDAKSMPANVPSDQAKLNRSKDTLDRAAADAAAANPALARTIQDDVAAIKKAAADVDNASANLARNQADPAANIAALQKSEVLAAAIDKLAHDIAPKKSNLAGINDDVRGVQNPLDRLEAAVIAENAPAGKEATEDAIKAAQQFQQDLDKLADKEPNPAKKQRMKDQVAAHQAASQNLLKHSLPWQKEPQKDEYKQALLDAIRNLRHVSDEGRGKATPTAAGLDSDETARQADAAKANAPGLLPEDRSLLDHIKAVAADAKQTVDDSQNNPGATPAASDKMRRSVADLIRAAEAAIAKASPNSAQQLRKSLPAVQSASDELANSAKASAANPADLAAQAQTAANADALNKALEALIKDSDDRAKENTARRREAINRRLADIAQAAAQQQQGNASPAQKALAAATAKAADAARATADSSAKPGAAGKAENAKAQGDLKSAISELERAGQSAASDPASDAEAKRAVPAVVSAAKAGSDNLASQAGRASEDPSNNAAAEEAVNAEEAVANALSGVLDEVAREQRSGAVEALRRAAANAGAAENAVRPAERHEMGALSRTAGAAADLVENLKAHPERAEAQAAQVAQALSALDNAAQEAAAAEQDPARKAAILKRAAGVKDIAQALTSAAKQAAMDPNNRVAVTEVNKAAEDLARAVDAAAAEAAAKKAEDNVTRRAAIKKSLLDSAHAPVAGTPSAEAAALNEAIKNYGEAAAALVDTAPTDGAGLTRNAANAAQASQNVERAAAAVAAKEKNPATKAAVEEQARAIAAATAEMQAGAARNAASANDAGAQEAVLAGGEKAADALSKLSNEQRAHAHDDAHQRLNDSLFGLAALGGDFDFPEMGDLLGIAGDLGRALGDLCGDLPRLSKDQEANESDKIKEMIEKFTGASRAAQMACKDPALKNQLADHCKRLKDLSAKADAAADEYAKNPTPENDMKVIAATDALAEEFGKFAADLKRAVPNKGGAGGPAQQSDVVINKLADEMKANTNKYATGETKDDPAVLQGMELADLMKRLAEAARDGRRSEIIQIAKAINVLAKKIADESLQTSKTCGDPKLKEGITASANGMKNFSTQLKIIASVKAASSDTDPAAENQLITCCQGIKDCYVQNLDAVIVAKLSRK